MRTIDRASSFKRDYKREAKGQHRVTLDSGLRHVLLTACKLLTGRMDTQFFSFEGLQPFGDSVVYPIAPRPPRSLRCTDTGKFDS